MRGFVLFLVAVLACAAPAFAEALPDPPAGLTLDQAITKALAHNPILLAAKADVQRAEAELGVARISPLRAVSANLGANTFTPQAAIAPMGGAYVTINVGDLLSTPMAMQGAEARLEATRQALRQTTLQVVAATTEAYGGWVAKQKVLAIRQEAIHASESDSVGVQRLFAKGTASMSDLMKAKLAVSQSQVDVLVAEGEAQRAWAVLLVQMGETGWLEKRSEAGHAP